MKNTSKKTETATGINFEKLDRADRHSIQDAIRKGWSRRDVMKLIMAIGATATTAHQIFSDGQAALAQTPKKGGSVRMASNIHGPDDTVDPNLLTSAIDYNRARATYNGLVQIGEGLVPQPELAESFTPNGDATEWTFKLREGVTFHDGSPMTAEDVVYSMNRHLGEDSTSVMKSIIESVKEWRKTGPNEVIAEMNTPNADLPSLLGLYQAKIIKDGSKGGVTAPGHLCWNHSNPV